jgi:hypothetical protein
VNKKIIIFYALSGAAFQDFINVYGQPDHKYRLWLGIAFLCAVVATRYVEVCVLTRNLFYLIVSSLAFGASIEAGLNLLEQHDGNAWIAFAVAACFATLIFRFRQLKRIAAYAYVCKSPTSSRIQVAAHTDSFDSHIETLRRLEAEIVADCPWPYQYFLVTEPIAYTVGGDTHKGKMLVWYEFNCAPTLADRIVQHLVKRGYKQTRSLPDPI